jgi:hypothetical protein
MPQAISSRGRGVCCSAGRHHRCRATEIVRLCVHRRSWARFDAFILGARMIDSSVLAPCHAGPRVGPTGRARTGSGRYPRRAVVAAEKVVDTGMRRRDERVAARASMFRAAGIRSRSIRLKIARKAPLGS